jgi:hypothetical protein
MLRVLVLRRGSLSRMPYFLAKYEAWPEASITSRPWMSRVPSGAFTVSATPSPVCLKSMTSVRSK